MISALTGDGCDDLLKALAAAVPAGPWLYPEDQISDLPLRSVASEITREKMLLRLHDELPYTSTVETTAWEDRKDGSVKIDQTIYVSREAHRKIVLGKGGQTIKAISQAARKEIAESDRAEGPSLPVRESAREMGRRSRTLPRDGHRVPQGLNASAN